MATTTTKKLWTFLLSFGHEVNSDGRHGVFSQLRPSLAAMCEGTTAPACENRPQTNRCSLVSSGGARRRPQTTPTGRWISPGQSASVWRAAWRRREKRKTKNQERGKDKREERKELHTGGRSFYLIISFIRDTGAAWRVAPTVSEHLQPPESCPPPTWASSPPPSASCCRRCCCCSASACR